MTTAAITPTAELHSVQPFQFKTYQEMYATPLESTRFLVRGLLPNSGTSVLLAKPKVGKTHIARQIAVSVVQGTEFLGRECEQGGVVYLACEEKQDEVALHLRELGWRESDPLYPLFGAVPSKREAVQQLKVTLNAYPNVKLVIIDTLFRFVGVKDGNDYIAVNDAMEQLGEVARNSGVHILVVHHQKKRLTDDRQDSSLGSTAITGGVDTVLYLDADRSGIRSISTQQRYGVEMPQTQLQWNSDTRSVTLGVACEEVARRSKEQTCLRIEKEVIAFVTAHPGCELAAILEAVSGKDASKLESINKLCAYLLVKSGAGKKGDPFTYTVCDVPTEGINDVGPVVGYNVPNK